MIKKKEFGCNSAFASNVQYIQSSKFQTSTVPSNKATKSTLRSSSQSL